MAIDATIVSTNAEGLSHHFATDFWNYPLPESAAEKILRSEVVLSAYRFRRGDFDWPPHKAAAVGVLPPMTRQGCFYPRGCAAG